MFSLLLFLYVSVATTIYTPFSDAVNVPLRQIRDQRQPNNEAGAQRYATIKRIGGDSAGFTRRRFPLPPPARSQGRHGHHVDIGDGRMHHPHGMLRDHGLPKDLPLPKNPRLSSNEKDSPKFAGSFGEKKHFGPTTPPGEYGGEGGSWAVPILFFAIVLAAVHFVAHEGAGKQGIGGEGNKQIGWGEWVTERIREQSKRKHPPGKIPERVPLAKHQSNYNQSTGRLKKIDSYTHDISPPLVPAGIYATPQIVSTRLPPPPQYSTNILPPPPVVVQHQGMLSHSSSSSNHGGAFVRERRPRHRNSVPDTALLPLPSLDGDFLTPRKKNVVLSSTAVSPSVNQLPSLPPPPTFSSHHATAARPNLVQQTDSIESASVTASLDQHSCKSSSRSTIIRNVPPDLLRMATDPINNMSPDRQSSGSSSWGNFPKKISEENIFVDNQEKRQRAGSTVLPNFTEGEFLTGNSHRGPSYFPVDKPPPLADSGLHLHSREGFAPAVPVRVPHGDGQDGSGGQQDDRGSALLQDLAGKEPQPIKHKRIDLSREGSDASKSLTSTIDFSELSLIRVIGGGGFGQVWKANWRGTPVAVKILAGSAKQTLSPNLLQEFLAEISMVSAMRHPNCILFMGACVSPPHPRAIVTELAARGSLWDALRQPLPHPYVPADGMTRDAWPEALYCSGGKPTSGEDVEFGQKYVSMNSYAIPELGIWPWVLVKRVAEGAARAMSYLHSGHPPVLHRDLKSANLLLDESFTVKICDFGLARLQQHDNSMTGNCGTVQWMAPEVLSSQRYSMPADVYSFGIILWELLTRECPYEGMTPIQCAMSILNEGKRPTIPQWCPPLLSTLIANCIAQDPSMRPSFEEILACLTKIESNENLEFSAGY